MSRHQDNQERKREKKIHMYYEIKDGTLVRKQKKCQRCGAFMAHHKERARWACGSCGYTQYISV